MELREDHWLASVLGREVFAVAEAPAAGAISGLADGLRAHAAGRRAMYYARIDPDRIDLVRELGAAGFYVVDTSVLLARAGTGDAMPRGADAVAVADARPEHHASALDIAEHAFRWSRFHLDPLIDRADADRVKREWIRSYVEGRRGERLLIATDGGRVVGFLAVLAADTPAGSVRTIDLIAVSPDAQGRGVGTALVSAFVGRYADRDRLEVGTQAANLGSIALYERCGFRVARARLVLHMHACAP